MGFDHCGRYSASRRNHFIILNIAVIASCGIAYLLNQQVLKRLSDNFLIQGYFNSFFATPLLLAYSNILVCLGRLHYLLFLSLTRIVPFAILAGLFWQYVTPLYRSSKVFNPYELVAYTLGSISYWAIVKCFARDFTKDQPDL
jgi:hypothetical protein